MARGFVRKRGDTWYAYWRMPDGRQRAKAIGRNKRTAEAFLNNLQTQLQAGVYRDLKASTFADFVDRWLDDYAEVNTRPSTCANYRSIFRSSLVPYFGEYRLAEIQAEDVQRFVAHKLKAVGPNTVRKHLLLLKTMFNHAVLWGYMRDNPALYVRPPRLPHREMDFMTPDEVRLFLEAVHPWYAPLFLTAIMTGMRLGELQALQWGDISWNNGTIRVQRSVWRGEFQDPKSKRSIRTVGMPRRLAEVLSEYKAHAAANEHSLVFTTPAGKMLDQSDLRRRVFEPTLERAGLRKMRIHDLRHTFASLLIDQGENLKYVQMQLGHASIQTTVDRYGHLMPDAHVGAMERLEHSLFGAALDDKPLTTKSEIEQAPSFISSGPA